MKDFTGKEDDSLIIEEILRRNKSKCHVNILEGEGTFLVEGNISKFQGKIKHQKYFWGDFFKKVNQKIKNKNFNGITFS